MLHCSVFDASGVPWQVVLSLSAAVHTSADTHTVQSPETQQSIPVTYTALGSVSGPRPRCSFLVKHVCQLIGAMLAFAWHQMQHGKLQPTAVHAALQIVKAQCMLLGLALTPNLWLPQTGSSETYCVNTILS